MLLQVMDDGRLTDGQGRLVDFKNAVIILTSNVGADVLLAGIQREGTITAATRAQVMVQVLRYNIWLSSGGVLFHFDMEDLPFKLDSIC